MKLTVATLLVIAISSFALAQGQRQQPASDGRTIEEARVEQVLRRIEDQTLAALRQSDAAALERVWADEYTFTPPNGIVMSKADYLAMLKSGAIKYESLEAADMNVQVYGDAAVVTGLVTVKGKVPGHTINGQDRYLTVYVKREGRWQQVATQAARVAQQSPGVTAAY